MGEQTPENQQAEEPPSTTGTVAPAADEIDDPLQFPAEPPSYEASTSQLEGAVARPNGAPLPRGPLPAALLPGAPLPAGFQAPPLTQKPRLGRENMSNVPVVQQQSYNGVISSDGRHFAPEASSSCNSRAESTRKHQKVLKCTGVWQLFASGFLFVLSVIKHVHGVRLYGLFGYASAAAGLLSGVAAIMCSHKPNKTSIVATVCLSGLAIAGGITGLVGNGITWRCPYVRWGGFCHRGHREARTTIGFSLFASALELVFGFGSLLVSSILLCRKESGRMVSTQSQGTAAPVNFVLQVTPAPAPAPAPAQEPRIDETDFREYP